MKDEHVIQILRAINDVREDVRDFKDEMNKRWDKNDKRWEANERRWIENDKRWEANEKRWIETEKKLDAINKKIDNVDYNAESRHRDTLKNFDAYENSIEIMYQDNRKRILAIEKRLKVANA